MKSTVDFDKREIEIEIAPGDKLGDGDVYQGPHLTKRFKLSDEEVTLILRVTPTR
jgi:hypothetical protein